MEIKMNTFYKNIRHFYGNDVTIIVITNSPEQDSNLFILISWPDKTCHKLQLRTMINRY